MEREEILALCASKPEAIVVYIKSLESQIKELSERLQALEARINQNSRNSRKPPSTYFIK
jgi:chaperonin cofactor prefoldin